MSTKKTKAEKSETARAADERRRARPANSCPIMNIQPLPLCGAIHSETE
jgi:hypothetical protein